MYAALIVIHVLVSVALVGVVLLQAGRGAELGAAFGSVGQATFSRGSTTFLSKFTTGLAVIFMVTSLSLAFLTTETPRQSVLAPGGQAEQAEPPSTPMPSAPVTPAPEAPADQPSESEVPRTLQPTDAPPEQQ